LRECKKAVPLSSDDAARAKNLIETLPERVDKKPYEKFLSFKPQSSGAELLVYQKVGCDVCNNFGYHGRIGIFEFLQSDNNFQEQILKSASVVALRKLAEAQKMVTMQQDGLLKVLSGETTFDEVKEATGPLEW